MRRPNKPIRRRARRPQLEACTPLVAIAAARVVVEEVAVWLGEPSPARYASALAHRARRVFAHSAPFRARVMRDGDAGRDTLHRYVRHWFAARLREERPDCFARLPADFAWGGELSARATSFQTPTTSPCRRGRDC